MKFILQIIMGAIVLLTLIYVLKSTGHYDRVCFYSTALASVILVIINEEVGE